MPRLSRKTSPTTILGIDPGIADTGYGIITIDNQTRTVLAYGSIKTPAGQAPSERLKTLHADLTAIIKRYKPTVAGVEQLFFARNVTTAMTVGQARGVVLLTLAEQNIPWFEFTPSQIKQALSGYGKASKQQVQHLVKAILKLDKVPKPDDAADALAIAICCENTNHF